MAIEIKYYRFTDPITDETTKNYGYAEQKTVLSSVLKQVEGEMKVLKYEPFSKPVDRKPSGEDVVEISQEEFEKLDTSGESMLSHLARERMYLRIKKLSGKKEKPIPKESDLLVQAKSLLVR